MQKKIDLSEKQCEEIAQSYKDGTSMREIHNKYGIGNGRIVKIIHSYGVRTREEQFGKHRKHPINKDFFKVIDTEEKAYILGFADGTVSAVNENVRIGLALRDAPHILKIAKFIHLSDPKLLIKYTTTKTTGYKSAYIDFHSTDIKQDLTALGCGPNKTNTLAFPKLPENMIHHFMRGMADGDGCIHNNAKEYIGEGSTLISSSKFIKTWNAILKYKLDINVHIKIYNEHIWISEVSGRHQVRKLLDFPYEDATIYLDRKYNLYQGMCEEMVLAKSRPMREYTIKEGFPNFDTLEDDSEIIELSPSRTG